jgi:hypothetical protein
MNKKLIALALVLLIAVGGLFAGDLSAPESITASLIGNVGKYLYHGFTFDGELYQQENVFFNVDFQGTSGVTFAYGFKTNYTEPLKFVMTVGNFIHEDGADTGSIAVVSVKNGATTIPFVAGSTTDYLLFQTVGNTIASDSINITVMPETFTEEQKNPGQYTSTVTITVSGA